MDGKSQQSHARPEDVTPPAIEQFIAETNGILPGYAGFRPEAGDAHDVSKFGGVMQRPPFHDPWAPKMQPNDPFKRYFEWRREKDITDDPPSFRESVGGVKSGYTGYVARGLFKIGTTHMGGSSPWERADVPLAQTGHEGYKISAPGQPVGMAGESEVTVRRIPKCTVSCISLRYPVWPRQCSFLLRGFCHDICALIDLRRLLCYAISLRSTTFQSRSKPLARPRSLVGRKHQRTSTERPLARAGGTEDVAGCLAQ